MSLVAFEIWFVRCFLIQESARQSLRRLCDGPAFVEMVNAACALMEREKVQLAETEEYLQRYGYTPVLTPSVETEHDGGETNGGEI